MAGGRHWRRLGAAAAVALLHVALAWVLLAQSREAAQKPQAAATREIFLYLQPRPLPALPHIAGKLQSRATVARMPALPDYRGITIPDSQGAPPPTLGRALFGCSPQEMADMTPQERARCGNALAYDDSVDYRDGTGRSRAAALWEFRRERKNAPLLLPCMSPQAPPGVSIYTILCLAKGAVDGGFDADSQASYADKVEQVQIPNGGDPPPLRPSGP